MLKFFPLSTNGLSAWIGLICIRLLFPAFQVGAFCCDKVIFCLGRANFYTDPVFTGTQQSLPPAAPDNLHGFLVGKPQLFLKLQRFSLFHLQQELQAAVIKQGIAKLPVPQGKIVDGVLGCADKDCAVTPGHLDQLDYKVGCLLVPFFSGDQP